MRLVLVVAILCLGILGRALAHDVPGESRVHAFVKPEANHLRVLVRFPLGLLANLDLPQLLPARSEARISRASDQSFGDFEQALAWVRGPRLADSTNVTRDKGYLDAYLEYPIASASGSFALDDRRDGVV